MSKQRHNKYNPYGDQSLINDHTNTIHMVTNKHGSIPIIITIRVDHSLS